MRLLLFLAFLLAVLLLVLNVTLPLFSLDGSLSATALQRTQTVLDTFSTGSWEFGKPLLQLVAVLAVGEWFISRLGLRLSPGMLGALNIQTFIAVVVVFAFCLAALGNLPGLPYLKDIVLIVIGFYFGSRTLQQSGSGVSATPTDKEGRTEQ
jgi:hypothetical protein